MNADSIGWYALSLGVGYLIGSISFAVLVARSRGVDIFKVGSGNPGATNVKRVLGRGPGNLVFGLDAFKGALAGGLPLLVAAWTGGDTAITAAVFGVAGAILGHSFSVFLRFRGGKGVATTMGGLLVLMPVVLMIGLVVWVIVFYATRIVAIASIVFGISLPVATYFTGQPSSVFVFSIILAVLLVVRHRSNIARLLRGEENAFKKS